MKYLALAFVLLLASPVFAAKPIAYEKAVDQFKGSEKLLLVLASSKSCPPCYAQKSTLLAMDIGEDVLYTVVDFEVQPTLFDKLVKKDRGTPQLVAFVNTSEGVKRFALKGYQKPAAVRSFLATVLSARGS